MNESVENTDWFSSFWSEGVGIWTGGGWAMIVLGVLAVVTFGLGVHVMMSIRSSGLGRLPERVWRRWLDEPGMRRGKVGALIDSRRELVVAQHVPAKCLPLQPRAPFPGGVGGAFGCHFYPRICPW